MLKITRKLSSFQKFTDFTVTPLKFAKKHKPIQEKEDRRDFAEAAKKPLVPLDNALMEAEFYTESSDFDVDEFSIRIWLEDCIRFRWLTAMKLLTGSFIWLMVSCFTIRFFWTYREFGRKIGAMGHFQLDTPAFQDMHKTKNSKRINFWRMHSFD